MMSSGRYVDNVKVYVYGCSIVKRSWKTNEVPNDA